MINLNIPVVRVVQYLQTSRSKRYKKIVIYMFGFLCKEFIILSYSWC